MAPSDHRWICVQGNDPGAVQAKSNVILGNRKGERGSLGDEWKEEVAGM